MTAGPFAFQLALDHMVVVIGFLVGVAVGVVALQWALRSHRSERAPWLELLATPAEAAARDGGLGALDGIASHAEAIQAPFTERPCIGFQIEVITEEQFGNETTWRRVVSAGDGRFAVVGPNGEPRGDVNLEGARPIFATPLDAYTKYSSVIGADTVFHGSMQNAPPRLHAFVASLPAEAAHVIMRPSQQLVGGKRVYFNERIVVPGQRVVAAGFCEPSNPGISVLPTEECPVSLGLGTIESERARVAKLPIAGELFGAIVAGVIACGVVVAVGSIVFK